MNWDKRSAFVFVKTVPGNAEKVWKRAQNWSHAIGAWIVTGEWDVIVWFDAKDIDEMYKWASTIRNWGGVTATSSHFVYMGLKNGGWWWEKHAGCWVLVRDTKLNNGFTKVGEKPWVTSAVSVPGSWDYLVWVSGESWEELWENVWELNKAGWQTLTKVPVKNWWNRSWEKKWWK